MTRRKCYWKCVLPILAFVIFSVPSAFGAETITIGIIGAMEFSNGQEMWNGAMMAVDEINQRGGIRLGQQRKKIRLIKADSKEFLNVGYATNTMEMLLLRNDVDFIVGGFRSEAVLAMQDVAMDYQKIFISIGAALPELCQRVSQNYDRYKYYFRNGVFNNYYLAKACFLQLAFVAQNMREALGLRQVKVAIAAERTSWVEGMIAAAKQNFPAMGLELVGVFRPSAVATNVAPELNAIANTRAPIIFTLFSSNVGTAFVSQAADMQIPAVQVGINVEAQKSDFWKTTKGKANYVVTTMALCRGVEITKLTTPFLENYIQRFGEVPTYTAASYSAIIHTLAPAIEQAATLDPDTLVSIIENRVYETPHGKYAYEKDQLGRHLHELKFGAEYAMMLGGQWQDGQMKGIWPKNYREKPEMPPLTYKGIVDFQIPPWILKAYNR